MDLFRRSSPKPTVNIPTFAALLCTGIAVVLTANAQTAPAVASPTIPQAPSTLGEALVSVTDILAGPATASTTVPLSNSFQPTVPWPVVTTVSQTALQAPHDLLSYSGVEAAARSMVGSDYESWRSHFTVSTEATSVLPNGMLMSSGCDNPCDSQKSLLIVDPATRKVFAALVTPGKAAIWPSLMSWPDESIPPLKRWLADATGDK